MNAAVLRLMLVDDDPVFRLGLRIYLEQIAGFVVVAEADQAETALTQLTDLARTDPAQPSAGSRSPTPALDLVILDLGLGAGDPEQLPGLGLCAEIKSRYPQLPVLVLSSYSEPVLQAAARQMGANGYSARSLPVRELAQMIEQLAQPAASLQERSADLGSAPAAALAPTLSPPLRPTAALRQRLQRSALSQIETELSQVRALRRQGRGSLLDAAVLAGRDRELRAARWLINRLLAGPNPSAETRAPAEAASSSAAPLGSTLPMPATPPTAAAAAADASRAVVRSASALQRGDLRSALFEQVFIKLQSQLENTTSLPLEIDILREEKKRELLYLTLRQLEDSLDELRRSQQQPGQVAATCPQLLRDLWQAITTDFFGRYYTLPLSDLEQPVVDTLLQEEATVVSAILSKIPQVPMLLGHLLFQEAMVIDGSSYLASTQEALERSRLLLENLVLQLANAVMQPLLNRFADVEAIKKYLYQRRLMSTRELERFRNDLSWRYRWDNLVNEPKAIFESQQRLLLLTPLGIATTFIYAPRQQELVQLSGLQRSITLAIEARDAIAPRLRASLSLVGSGLVYLLTDVLGRGIGLIGRGIIKGVGNAWSDPRYRRKG